MLVLSETQIKRVADAAALCREMSRGCRRPTLMRYGRLAASVGTDDTVLFYAYDGASIYRAQFDVAPDGNICWTENDFLKNASESSAIIDSHYAGISAAHSRDENASAHWCSIGCWREHG